MENRLPPGIMLVDKPKGITSFDVIRKLRQKLGIRKMGHAGTLDPNATGLLIVAVGDATKLLSSYLKLPKTYVAELSLGIRTDTGDVDGTVIEKKEVPQLSEDLARRMLESMKGDIEMPVPKYSAIKQQGKPLYKYAREGAAVVVPTRTMSVREARLLDMKDAAITVEWHVGSGTYIRSLAEEFGKRLGTVATLRNLRRTSIGDFSVEEAEQI